MAYKVKLHKRNHQFMRVIAVEKVFYGLVLLGLGVTIFNSIGKNLANELFRVLKTLHIYAHIYYIHWFLQKISTVGVGLLIVITMVNFMLAWLSWKPLD